MPFKTKEAIRIYQKQRRIDLKAKGLCLWCSAPRANNTKYCDACKIKSRQSWKKGKQKCWKTIFEYLGDICVCCGESNKKFLTIDHINNDGYKEKKEPYGKGSNIALKYAAKIRRGEKIENLQILCFNCNCGKARNKGICPHVG